MPTLLILGTRTRPAADSARRAGYEPIEIRLTEDRQDVLRRLDDAPHDVELLLANGVETHAELIEAAMFQRKLIGSGPDAIRAARDPAMLATLPPSPHIGFAVVRTGGRFGDWFGKLLFRFRHRGRFLLKPIHGTDGRGIREWDRDEVPLGCYVQQAIEGKPLGAVFFADGWSCVLVGVTEQLVGETVAGAERFQYCGSIYPFQLEEAQRAAVTRLAVALAQRHDLRGLFGVDLVVDGDGVLWPIEVNPRYTDSVEVIERSDQINALQGRPGRTRDVGERATHHGKLLVRLSGDAPRTVHNLRGKLPKLQLADVPPDGAVLQPGELLATVYATASSRVGCVEQLRELAEQVHAAVG